MRRHRPSLLWCAAVQGRWPRATRTRPFRWQRVHSDHSFEGVNHGTTNTRQDRRRGCGAGLRLRRRGRAHGARHRRRPGARGGAGACARHQLLRHRARLRRRRVGEEPRPCAQDAQADRGRRHQVPHSRRCTRPRRPGGDGLPRGEPGRLGLDRVDLLQLHNPISEDGRARTIDAAAVLDQVVPALEAFGARARSASSASRRSATRRRSTASSTRACSTRPRSASTCSIRAPACRCRRAIRRTTSASSSRTRARRGWARSASASSPEAH